MLHVYTHSSVAVHVLDLVHNVLCPVVHGLVYTHGSSHVCVHNEPVHSSGRLAVCTERREERSEVTLELRGKWHSSDLPDWNLKAMLLEPYCLMWSICHLTMSLGGSFSVNRAMWKRLRSKSLQILAIVHHITYHTRHIKHHITHHTAIQHTHTPYTLHIHVHDSSHKPGGLARETKTLQNTHHIKVYSSLHYSPYITHHTPHTGYDMPYYHPIVHTTHTVLPHMLHTHTHHTSPTSHITHHRVYSRT